ncbi:hypothetical protein J6590_024931 [Homalodisca vitripennis]|nr:hypothetical protein J6590_024931 [Homalodisca vitripennis]
MNQEGNEKLLIDLSGRGDLTEGNLSVGTYQSPTHSLAVPLPHHTQACPCPRFTATRTLIRDVLGYNSTERDGN